MIMYEKDIKYQKTFLHSSYQWVIYHSIFLVLQLEQY